VISKCSFKLTQLSILIALFIFWLTNSIFNRRPWHRTSIDTLAFKTIGNSSQQSGIYAKISC
jgi:hypothetical protein